MNPLPQPTQTPRTPQGTQQAPEPREERPETRVVYVTPQRDSFIHPVSGRRVERTAVQRRLQFDAQQPGQPPQNQQASPRVMARPRVLTFETPQETFAPQPPHRETRMTPPSPSPRRLSAAARELQPGFVTPPPRYQRLLDGLSSPPELTWSTDEVIRWARPLHRAESPCPSERNQGDRTQARTEAHHALAQATQQPVGERMSFDARDAGPLLRR